MQSYFSWAVPFLGAILIVLIPGLLRMSNRMALQDERQTRQEDDASDRFDRVEKAIDKQEAHNARQDEQINEIGKFMARIDERTEHIVKGLERVGVIQPHQ
jgi:hypothetical protein